jgi:hypothetical protein
MIGYSWGLGSRYAKAPAVPDAPDMRPPRAGRFGSALPNPLHTQPTPRSTGAAVARSTDAVDVTDGS